MNFKEDLEGKFATNHSLNGGAVPYITGMTHEQASKKWEGTKVILARKIVLEMDTCKLVNGDEFAMAVWAIVAPQLATVNWVKPCGVFVIWRVMYRKASAKVQQSLPQQPQEASTLIADMLGKSLVKARTNDEDGD